MAQFFIDRPIFAWVIALFIIVFGGVSVKQLPVAQYPTVAPPAIVLTATYPGASAQTLEDGVISVIEQEMNGSPGMIYMESVSQSNGVGTITITYDSGTNIDLAQVDVQNRLARAAPRLPATVTQQGVRVDKARNNFLLFVILSSDDPKFDPIALGDYASRNVLPEIQRVPGVGQATLFGTERSMRIWLDPNKLVGFGLTPADVNAAIRAQNAQVASGSIGDLPAAPGQTIAATVVTTGQLSTVEQFSNIVLRSNTDGSTVRLKDVARVELGGLAYATNARLNGKPSTGIGVQLTPTGNALATAEAIHTRMGELSRYFPAGVKYDIPYDSSKFVKISITQVVETLVEAVVLVFLVMFLFLQNIRYTIIPTIVVPVALLGSVSIMYAMGFSINVLTMFAMVLAVGILVDDAIVVIENVERIMSHERLSPREATKKAMGQITAALVGITTTLVSVFIPMAFFSGSVGNIYRQFSLVMVSAMLFSVFLAMSLTPALCATFLKPVPEGHHDKRGFFGWFNRGFTRTTQGYHSWVQAILHRTGRFMLIFVGLVVVVGWLFMRMPGSFLPNEDQGYVLINIQLPAGASDARTLAVVKQAEDFALKQPEVDKIVTVTGFSFSGSGQNAALAFVPLKPWEERTGPNSSASAVSGRIFMALSGIRDAFIFALSPPAIPELGNSTGFTFRLQDRGANGHAALLAARNQMLGMAMQSKVLAGVRPDGLEDGAQLRLNIDRDKAQALGVSFDAINAALSTSVGSTYVNDFINAGRLQRVLVQADSPFRMQPEDLLKINVISTRSGTPVPLSSFATTDWVTGPTQTIRYNGYPAMRIAGDAAPGYSTGQAIEEMERLAAQLPPGFGYEWTGQSREEKLSGSQATILLGLSLLAVFLCLSALYESWSIPLSVVLVVPLGVLGALLGATFRDLPNDVFFKVGLITVIGLSAKNAILIIEFAKDLVAEGKDLYTATLEAAQLRFRPILMTSIAFILGVLPLVLSSGAGANSQHAIGTGVMFGMMSATVLAVFFVPVFFVVVRSFFKGSERQRRVMAQQAAARHIDGTAGGVHE